MIAILIAFVFPVLFYCFVKIALSQQNGTDSGMDYPEAKALGEMRPSAE
jgi:hypothetical protein